MAGIDNDVNYGLGYRLSATTASQYPIMQKAATDVGQYNNAGSPEGVVSANVGSICQDRTNGVIYVKNTGTGNTGWVIPGSITTTQYDVLVGGAANTVGSVGPGSTGQVLQSGGNAANPGYSTATYPSIATGTGTILRANGTNWLASTSTYPDTNAVSTLLYASSSNVMGALPTANLGVLNTGATGVPSIATSITLGNTTSGLGVGAIKFGTTTMMSNYGTRNAFLGGGGNTTLTAVDTVAIGDGSATTLSSGNFNTAVGASSLHTNSTGASSTAMGYNALYYSNANNCSAFGASAAVFSTGINNSAFGASCLYGCTTGTQNCAFGASAMASTMTTSFNCAYGSSSLYANTGTSNTAYGSNSLASKTTGDYNVAVGDQALYSLATGSSNIGIGRNGGSSLTGTDSNNIMIGNTGTAGDSGKIVIGTSGTHTSAYIHGVSGVSVANTLAVTMNSSTGQLGTAALGNLPWTEVTGTSQAAAVNNGYIANNVALVTVTLPATFAIGDIVRVGGKGAGLFALAASGGDTIQLGASVTSAGGSLTALAQYNTLEVVGITANSAWLVLSSMGSFTVA